VENLQDLVEERRLLYVAITRAKKTLTMTYADSRRFFEGRIPTLPSRFITELDKNYFIDRNDFFERETKSGSKFFAKANVTVEAEKYFKIGQKIAHDKFGKGVILDVNGKGKDAKLTISFSNGKLKKIIGTFVKI
jgi:DNA helicase-2/ATP-dependent DNA helicase PcrA